MRSARPLLVATLASLLLGATHSDSGVAIIAALADLRAGLSLAEASGETAARGLAVLPAAQPGPCGRHLTLARAAGDSCSPEGAFLLCPGLRLLTQGPGPAAPVIGLWHTLILPTPRRPDRITEAAQRRWGAPADIIEASEWSRGRDLQLRVMRWHAAGIPAREVELTFVLAAARDGPVSAVGLSSVAQDAGGCPAP